MASICPVNAVVFWGAAHDPFVAGDPSVADYQVPGLALPAEMASERLERRQAFAALLDLRTDIRDGGAADFATHYRAAWELLSTSDARHAFDLEQEPLAVRERYGFPDRVDRSVEARSLAACHISDSACCWPVG